MKKNKNTAPSYGWHSMALILLVLLLWTGRPASGQSAPPRNDNDTREWQIANMDTFLDSHPEIEEQLRKDPSLIKNDEFVEKHPALQEYLQQHPGIREEFTENPNAFMRREQQYERQEDVGRNDRDDRGNRGDHDTTRAELATMDRFMDGHPEIAEQLRKDPSLVKNKEFVENHPALQEFLQTHPEVREEFREDPNAFMHQEARFERHEDDLRGDRDDRDYRGDHDTTRAELATADRFLDGHPEIAEQLHKDPSLIKNKEFVENHPALQEFLQTHPEVREEFREDPNAFMRQEQHFDRREDSRDRDLSFRDRDREAMSNFGQFLGGHTAVADQLSKDPSLANNKEFLASHPELGDYLKAHPEMKQELAKDPQAVVTSATRPAGTTTPTTPKVEPKKK